MIFYELWDQKSGNLLGSYAAEWEALALVRELATRAGPIESLALVWGDEDDGEQGEQIAAGPELLARAQAAKPTSA